jgi:hypothetical protein
MITIELSIEQAQQLAQLIEIAIKAGGIPNAKVGIPLFEKIEQAVRNSQSNG